MAPSWETKENNCKNPINHNRCMFIKISHYKQVIYHVGSVMSVVNNNVITFVIVHYVYILYIKVNFHIIINQMGTLQFAKLHSKFNVLLITL